MDTPPNQFIIHLGYPPSIVNYLGKKSCIQMRPHRFVRAWLRWCQKLKVIAEMLSSGCDVTSAKASTISSASLDPAIPTREPLTPAEILTCSYENLLLAQRTPRIHKSFQTSQSSNRIRPHMTDNTQTLSRAAFQSNYWRHLSNLCSNLHQKNQHPRSPIQKPRDKGLYANRQHLPSQYKTSSQRLCEEHAINKITNYCLPYSIINPVDIQTRHTSCNQVNI